MNFMTAITNKSKCTNINAAAKLSTDEDTNGVNMKGLSSPNDKKIAVVAPPKKSEKTKANLPRWTHDPSRKPATAIDDETLLFIFELVERAQEYSSEHMTTL